MIFDDDNILLFKKSDNEYIIGYNDVNKMIIAPLQLKIKNFFANIHKLNNITVMSIQSDDKELFRKIREILIKIVELIGINNVEDFVKNTTNDSDEFIMVDVDKNTSFVEGNYRNEVVIVLDSAIDNYLKTSLVQVRKHNCFKYIY